jgi:Xaa-Pro aminopeptidase
VNPRFGLADPEVRFAVLESKQCSKRSSARNEAVGLGFELTGAGTRFRASDEMAGVDVGESEGRTTEIVGTDRGQQPRVPAAMSVADRMGRARQLMERDGLDALVVTNLINIGYLTGFTGTAGVLVMTPTEALLTTDGRYDEQSHQQLAAAGVQAEIVIGRPTEQAEALSKLVPLGARVGLEASDITWARQMAYSSGALSSRELVPTTRLIEELRRFKDQGEIDRIEAACDIADAALLAVAGRLADGISEMDFAAALDCEMRRLGASDRSFDTIVGAGPNGAKPHARASERIIKPGELVVVDFGALVEGYHSDMTRMLCLGDPGSNELSEMFDVVFESQRAGVEAVSSGTTAGEVDQVCRKWIELAGMGQYFVHSTGHGVGLDVHEEPWVAQGVDTELQPGMVVTVEPGVYRGGIGGVRIEDTLVVTEQGCRSLTKAPRELIRV